MGKRLKRRSWSDEEKREICQQAKAPGISVARLARRYALNGNRIHNWLKDERFAPEPDDGCAGDESDAFLEVDLTDFAPAVPNAAHTLPALGVPVSAMRIDLTLSDGRRILIDGPMALSAIVNLVEGLAS